MAQLTVRGLDEELIRKLKLRAAENGRSAEAEHREILKQALGNGAEDWWAEARRLCEASENTYGLSDDSGKLQSELREEMTRRDSERAGVAKPRRR